MRTTFTLIVFLIANASFSQTNKVHVGLNLSSYLSNQTDLGIGADLTLGFGQKHQLSLGTKIPFHRIGREKTNIYVENFGIINAGYQYFFWQKESGIRTFAVLNLEYTFWNYQRDFFYTEGEIVYETMSSSTSFDYSFNAQNGIGSRGLNAYAGIGAEIPISKQLYFSGFAAIGLGSSKLTRNFTDMDNSIELIDNLDIYRRSFAFQGNLSIGFRFN